MPSIGGLATISALNALENKIPNIRSLLKKKKKKKIITQILLKLKKKKLAEHDHDKYITTAESNNLAAKISTSKFSSKDRFWWQTKKSQSKN